MGKEKINFDKGFSMASSRVIIKTDKKNFIFLFFLLNRRAIIKGRERVDKKLEYS